MDNFDSYDDFLKTIEDVEKQCRYAIVDISFETTDNRPTSKMVMVSWIPDTAKIREKMMYAGSKQALQSSCSGIGIQIDASDFSDLDFDSMIMPRLLKFSWKGNYMPRSIVAHFDSWNVRIVPEYWNWILVSLSIIPGSSFRHEYLTQVLIVVSNHTLLCSHTMCTSFSHFFLFDILFHSFSRSTLKSYHTFNLTILCWWFPWA